MHTSLSQTGKTNVPGTEIEVTLVDGMAAVPSRYVPAALRAGWAVASGEPWPVCQMATGLALTGKTHVPGTSGIQVAVTNGIATVPAEAVPCALRAGWAMAANEPWPACRVAHLSAPAGGPLNATIALPDGNTAEVMNGDALIPHKFATQFLSNGWTPTPGLSGLDI
jgi:hypothetical protein